MSFNTPGIAFFASASVTGGGDGGTGAFGVGWVDFLKLVTALDIQALACGFVRSQVRLAKLDAREYAHGTTINSAPRKNSSAPARFSDRPDRNRLCIECENHTWIFISKQLQI